MPEDMKAPTPENRPWLPGDPKPGTGPTHCVTETVPVTTSQDKLDELKAKHGLDQPQADDE